MVGSGVIMVFVNDLGNIKISSITVNNFFIKIVKPTNRFVPINKVPKFGVK